MAAPAGSAARRVLRTFRAVDFSGGWNPRSTPALLADNESPDMLNVTIDNEGGLVKRLGYAQVGAALPGPAANLFFWPTAMAVIAQVGTSVYQAFGWSGLGSWTLIHTFSNDARAAFCDFQGDLVSVHPVDGVATLPNGGTWTAVSPSPKGSIIAVWQNKVWVAGDPVNISRVWASNAGDPKVWDMSSDYNDMREKDNTAVTALIPGQGFDAVGRPGLMVLKKDWWGRIDDPKKGDTIGRYITLHNEAGAAGPESVTTAMSGQICAINQRGIYVSDGVNAPQYVSSKVENLFNPVHLNFQQARRWTAIPYRDRVCFCLTRGTGQLTNNFMLEYHPTVGWFVPHNIGFGSTALFNSDEFTPYGASVSDGKIFQLFKGWSDDGANIAAHHQTRWFGPGEGYKFRMRRLRIDAHGSFDFYTRGDYSSDPGILNHFTDNSDDSTWADNFESFDDFWSLNVAKVVAWRLEENSQTPAFGRRLLGDGPQPEIGSFALFGYLLDFVRLGYA